MVVAVNLPLPHDLFNMTEFSALQTGGRFIRSPDDALQPHLGGNKMHMYIRT